jgi:hypothetical protein
MYHIDNTIAINRIESAIIYPDFLFPFLFFRAPPTVLPATSAISRARFGCRPSNCAVGVPATTDTGCAIPVGFASGSCSLDDLASTLSPPSAGSTTEVPGITNFGSENTARYVLRVSGNSQSCSQQVSKNEQRGKMRTRTKNERFGCAGGSIMS